MKAVVNRVALKEPIPDEEFDTTALVDKARAIEVFGSLAAGPPDRQVGDLVVSI